MDLRRLLLLLLLLLLLKLLLHALEPLELLELSELPLLLVLFHRGQAGCQTRRCGRCMPLQKPVDQQVCCGVAVRV